MSAARNSPGYRFTGVLCTNTVTGASTQDAPKAAVWPNFFSTELSAIAPLESQFELTHKLARGKTGIPAPNVCRTRSAFERHHKERVGGLD